VFGDKALMDLILDLGRDERRDNINDITYCYSYSVLRINITTSRLNLKGTNCFCVNAQFLINLSRLTIIMCLRVSER